LKQPTERRRKRVRTLIALAALTTILGLTNTAAYAKGAAVVEHLHTGQKIANAIRAATGLPDLAVLAIISALPVVELRGAVPVGIWMGYPISTVFPVCVLGNIAPIIPLLVLLRNESLRKLLKPVLDRAEKKTSELGIGSIQKQWTSLAAFVGIPLPGTVSKTCRVFLDSPVFALNSPFDAPLLVWCREHGRAPWALSSWACPTSLLSLAFLLGW
jgi:Putative small multi-drug export protein